MGNKQISESEIKMDTKFSRADPAIQDFENFSLEMDGYIKTPADSQYIFRISCDDFCILYINDILIEDSYNPKKDIKKIFLLGQKKYKIQIKYSHSVHNLFRNYDDAFLKVTWNILNILQTEEIPIKYLYKSNKMSPLKISDFDNGIFEHSIFNDFRNAFKNEEQYKLADIPFQFQGTQMLRMIRNFNKNEIKIKTNSPTVIYLGLPFENKNEWNILDKQFRNTQKIFSVLRMGKAPNISIKAQESIKYIIFERIFDQEDIEIQLQNENKQRLNWILFYKQNLESENDFLKCGGEIEEISNIKGEYFESCNESSSYKNGEFGCENGLNGKMSDEDGNIWASNNEGLGAYLQVNFKNQMQITSFEYLNRENINQRTKQLKVQFQNGLVKTFEIKNHKAINKIQLDNPIISNYIKFTISDVYSSGNNGGAFRVQGIKCSKNKLTPSPEASNDQLTFKLKCIDNLNSNSHLKTIKKNIGTSLRIFCDEGCNDKDLIIYGDKIFSQDSSICKAGYYMGVIKENGGMFEIKMVKGLEIYESGVSVINKIQSQFQKGSSDQLAFTVVEIIDNNIKQLNDYFNGQRVDLYDDKLKQWLNGVIINLERQSLSSIRLEIAKEGYDQQFNEVIVVNKDNVNSLQNKLEFCGSKIPDRLCDSRSKRHSSNLLQLNFCFTVLNKCDLSDSFATNKQDSSEITLVDNGQIFGEKSNGVYYGWNRKMEHNLRQRQNGHSFIEKNLILFAPNPQSKWCVEKKEIDCENSFWQIQVKNGVYNVKVTMGDSEYNSKYFLRVNEEIVARSMYLGRNQWYTSSTKVKVKDEKIKISADCDKDCDQVWSRMSFVRVQELGQEKTNQEVKQETVLEKLACGNSYKGGRCQRGPDVENCVYQKLDDKGLQHCHTQFKLVKIPITYHCLDQRAMFKCIKSEYLSDNDCSLNCPFKCNYKNCSVSL